MGKAFPEQEMRCLVRLMRVKNSRSYRKREKEQKEQVVVDQDMEKDREVELEYLKDRVKSLQNEFADIKSREIENKKREERNNLQIRDARKRLSHQR